VRDEVAKDDRRATALACLGSGEMGTDGYGGTPPVALIPCYLAVHVDALSTSGPLANEFDAAAAVLERWREEVDGREMELLDALSGVQITVPVPLSTAVYYASHALGSVKSVDVVTPQRRRAKNYGFVDSVPAPVIAATQPGEEEVEDGGGPEGNQSKNVDHILWKQH